MARYRLLWLEIAEQQYFDLDDLTRDMTDRHLTMLELDPHSLAGAVYDAAPDQWTISLGDRGLLLYAVVADPPTVIILRLLLVFH